MDENWQQRHLRAVLGYETCPIAIPLYQMANGWAPNRVISGDTEDL